MRQTFYLPFVFLLLLITFTACSGGGDYNDPAMPADTQTGSGLTAPDLTFQSPPRDPSLTPDIPSDPDYAIELNPSGESVEGNFTFGGSAVEGIEVRINDEIADVTDENGDFEVPSILDGDHIISFSIMGHKIHSQPYSPFSRFAQDAPSPGPGVLTGVVYDEAGPVAGALVVVVKGDNYAYAFSGQFGQFIVTGAPGGNCLAVCMADFHDPVFAAVNLPLDGTPVEKNFLLPQNLTFGHIYGRVLSPGIGAVPFALVQYESPGVFRADLSNIFGIFELEAIPVGTGMISAIREGFYPVSGDVEVYPGVNPLPVIMTVIEQSIFHGYVVNELGEPINGALVKLAVFEDGQPYPMVYGKFSGPGGYYNFEDLLPGAYVIKAFLPGMIPAAAVGYILPGSLIEETLVMVPGEGGYAYGWVQDYLKNPVHNAIVQLRYIGSTIGFAAATNENGFWQLTDIPYGICEVEVQSAEFMPAMGQWEVLPDENEGIVAIVFPVPQDVPTGELEGSISNTLGEALPYSLVWAFNIANPQFSFMTLADENGDYYFPNAAYGTTGGWALAEGYKAGDGYVEVIADAINELNFQLAPE